MHHPRTMTRTAAPALAACLIIGLAGQTAALAVTPTMPAPAADVSRVTQRCSPGVAEDINGDGFADVAVAEPGDDRRSGSVHVFYGHRSGLVFDATGTARNDVYLSQDTPGVPGTAEPGDAFGTDTVLADFNGDGCADLAVGSPGENQRSGWIHVFYGSPTGLSTTDVSSFGMAGLFGAGSSSPDQELGDTLTAGDLNGDRVVDLAAGMPALDVAGKESAGGVAVLYGSTRGLNLGAGRPVLLTRDTPGIPGGTKGFAGFGTAVVTGDFDGDAKTELAIGVTNGVSGGAVQVVAHTATGVHGNQPIGRGSAGLPGDDFRFCAFGSVLASGDVHDDGRDDLAVADPSYGCRDAADIDYGAGAVVLLPGSPAGLIVDGSQIWTQDSADVDGVERLGNIFGEALAMGPLDRGATADLVVGAPFDSAGGSVTLLLGGPKGLHTAGAGGTRYTQSTAGIGGTDEPGDGFGGTLTAAFLQSRSQASVVIGTPFEGVGVVAAAGAVTQLSISGSTGPNPMGSRTFTAATPGIQGDTGSDDNFGDSTRRWG